MSDDTEETVEKRSFGNEATQFKPGNSGRPKGARNKLGEAFIQALHDDFNEHGVAAVKAVREEKPDQYLKVIASLMPKDHNINITNVDEMSDAELAERIRTLASQLAPFLTDGTGNAVEGNDGSAGAQLAARVH